MTKAEKLKNFARAEKLKHLERWAEVINGSNEQIDALHRVTGTCDGPLIDSIWILQDFATDMTAELVQDKVDFSALDWYRQENAMGKKGLKAGPKGKLKPIKCLTDLVWLLETT